MDKLVCRSYPSGVLNGSLCPGSIEPGRHELLERSRLTKGSGIGPNPVSVTRDLLEPAGLGVVTIVCLDEAGLEHWLMNAEWT